MIRIQRNGDGGGRCPDKSSGKVLLLLLFYICKDNSWQEEKGNQGDNRRQQARDLPD